MFLGLLSLVGWGLASSLPMIASYLSADAPPSAAKLPRTAAVTADAQPSPTPTAKVEATVAATPMLTPTATPAPAPTATPKATPQPTPQAAAPAPQAVAAAPMEAAATGQFTLQISASQERADAEAQVAKLKTLGLSARAVTVTLPQKGVWHRVHVGRYATREAATRAGQQLQAQKSISTFLVTAYQQ
ncbi:MAG: SPOR domain-containing protein [Blastocatellia bacterium]